jgi:hypothetical protein
MNLKNPWNIYRTRFLVRARQLTEPLVFIDSLGREHSGQPGDYLVENSNGIRRVITQALFEDIYVALAPAQLDRPASAVPESLAPALARPATRTSAGIHFRATA